MINYGSLNLKEAYFNEKNIKEIYWGDLLIWSDWEISIFYDSIEPNKYRDSWIDNKMDKIWPTSTYATVNRGNDFLRLYVDSSASTAYNDSSVSTEIIVPSGAKYLNATVKGYRNYAMFDFGLSSTTKYELSSSQNIGAYYSKFNTSNDIGLSTNLTTYSILLPENVKNTKKYLTMAFRSGGARTVNGVDIYKVWFSKDLPENSIVNNTPYVG